MADQKLTALTEDTALVGDDLMYAVIDTAGTPTQRKIKVSTVTPWEKILDQTVSSPVASVTFAYDMSDYSEVRISFTNLRSATPALPLVSILLELTTMTGSPTRTSYVGSVADETDYFSGETCIYGDVGNATSGAVSIVYNGFSSNGGAGVAADGFVDSLDSVDDVTVTIRLVDNEGSGSAVDIAAGRVTVWGRRR